MEILTFKLEEFEGPMDLLLHLISKNKMNIYDIAILDLIDQYTAVIDSLQTGKLEIASEFIEMAARLVQMKSFLLLPRSEEAERMKEELTGQLIEYSACKEIAKKMGVLAQNTFLAVRKPMQIELDATYTLRHEPRILQQAWNALMGRSVRRQPPTQERFEPLVTAPFVSVTSRVVHVLKGLLAGKIKGLHGLFHKQDSRSQTVATFLAVLELVRAGRVTIEQDETLMIKRKKANKQEAQAWN